ncbi:hypothetical protein D3C85_1730250 [compost metagenome]
MRRYIALPFHAGVFHRDRGVKSFRDSVGDLGLALFLEQIDQVLLLIDQRVDAGGFIVEEASNLDLL